MTACGKNHISTNGVNGLLVWSIFMGENRGTKPSTVAPLVSNVCSHAATLLPPRHELTLALRAVGSREKITVRQDSEGVRVTHRQVDS